MKIWETSIRQPVFTTMMMVALAVLGIIVYLSMPLDFFPEVSYPAMAVVTIYPGASPGEVQTQVTKPIEEALMTAPGVQDVQAASSESLSMVVVMFNLDTDVNRALQDVRNKIANVRSKLPEDVLEPSVVSYDPSAVPIINISVAAQTSGSAENIRQTVVDDVLPRLQRTDGVADAAVTGGRQREIQVLLDANSLKARHLAPQQVVQAVVAESYSIPGGNIQQQGQNLLLRTPATSGRSKMSPTCKSPRRWARSGSAMWRSCKMAGRSKTPSAGWMARRRWSSVSASSRAPTPSRWRSGSKKPWRRLRTERPDLNLAVVRDQSIFVQESFNDAMRELIIGAVMASLVVLLFFRNVRNTLVTVAGLPFIVLGTFAVMRALGLTLNIVSLLALALSVGLVIDDAIVVRENIFRHMEAGETPKEASRKGTRRSRAAGARHVADHRLGVHPDCLRRRAGRQVHELLRRGGERRRIDLALRGDDLRPDAFGLPVQAEEGRQGGRR